MKEHKEDGCNFDTVLKSLQKIWIIRLSDNASQSVFIDASCLASTWCVLALRLYSADGESVFILKMKFKNESTLV